MTATLGRRILFLCPALDAGGAERHWAALLPELRSRGLAIRLVALKGGGRALEHLRAAGTPVREMGFDGVASLAALPGLLAEGRGRPEAIVSFGYNAHALAALVARPLRTCHVLNWHEQEGWPLAPHEAAAVRFAARLGAGAIAVTRAQVPDLEARGFPSGRIRVVPNGTGPCVHTDRPALRRRLGLPVGGVVAALVARLRPEKRVVDFVDACARVGAEMPGFRGIVVGDGPLEADLRRHAIERGAPVDFAGYQPEPTEWMMAADVVCLTSAFEALPMVLIEALACRRPCVTTAVGGTTEIVEDGANGFVVAPRDVPGIACALRRIAADPALRERMGAESFTRWRARFSSDVMADAYAELLGSVNGMPVSFPSRIG